MSLRATSLGLFLAATLQMGQTASAGLLAESTRVIYEADQHQHSLVLANVNPYPVVVQTWMDQGGGDPDQAHAPFIVLPAVFRLEPQAIGSLRIIHNGDALPQDRESVFWLNLYEIPPTDGEEPLAQAQLTLTMNTQLKVFYRPARLSSGPDDVASRLRFALHQQDGQWLLRCVNPTPYHASFSRISLEAAGQSLPVQQEMDMMTGPFTERLYQLGPDSPAARAKVRFNLIDDAGFPVLHEASLTP